jgi:(p)ppGpp synthase/HD superfamily hydrolase
MLAPMGDTGAQGTLTVEEAVAIAREAHADQRDKAAAPYIDHPLRVMQRFHDELHQIVAVLHDVVEDAGALGYDLEYLRQRGAPRDVIEAIDALSHRPGEPDETYWARVAANSVAQAVKLADIADNSNPERLARLAPDERERLTAKYARARAALRAPASEAAEA